MMAAQTGARARWFDPRLGIGIALVVASIVGVIVVVSVNDSTAPVFAARSAIAVGERITASDLVSTEANLGSASSRYLADDGLIDDGAVATRSIAAGELVPVAAVGREQSTRVAPIVIEVVGRLPSSVQPGAVVDVWAAARAEGGAFGPPSVLVGGASVIGMLEPSGVVASAQAVEILVPNRVVAAVLEAIANADAITVVPSTGRVAG